MKGHLTMSQKERQRHLVLDRVFKHELRLSEAVRILEISYRHGQRLVHGYRERGESSLVHGLRGRSGTRRSDPDFKALVLERYRVNYKGFGPTLAWEKLLERDGLAVNTETLRLWLIENGDWTPQEAAEQAQKPTPSSRLFWRIGPGRRQSSCVVRGTWTQMLPRDARR